MYDFMTVYYSNNNRKQQPSAIQSDKVNTILRNTHTYHNLIGRKSNHIILIKKKKYRV